MKFQARLAKQIVEIDTPYTCTHFFCHYYLLNENEHKTPDITVQIAEDDIDFERNNSQKSYQETNSKELSEGNLEFLAVYRKICEVMPVYDTFLMHGAVVAHEGQGYMFSAPSGTGKTTRMYRFMEEFPGSIVVNGDKPLLKVADGGVTAYGTPWSGKEHMNVNTSVPLKAIFYVERADEGEDATVTELSGMDAFTLLLQQTYRPADPEAMKKTLTLLRSLVSRVKVYRFRGSPTREAVRQAYEAANT